MTRSAEVQQAMVVARRPGPQVWRYDEYWAALKALAPEVERLEAELLKMTAWHESALSVALEMAQRAVNAEKAP